MAMHSLFCVSFNSSSSSVCLTSMWKHHCCKLCSMRISTASNYWLVPPKQWQSRPCSIVMAHSSTALLSSMHEYISMRSGGGMGRSRQIYCQRGFVVGKVEIFTRQKRLPCSNVQGVWQLIGGWKKMHLANLYCWRNSCTNDPQTPALAPKSHYTIHMHWFNRVHQL